MDFFGFISLFGGLALFLYGMSVLGGSLEKASEGRLEKILERLTGSVLKGVLLGAVVIVVLGGLDDIYALPAMPNQSSSAATVIVVGLVNARVMKLRQAIGVIMGANIGTTVTAHILRLSGGDGGFLLRLIAPTTLAPAMAIAGILLFMLAKGDRLREVGQMLLGFGVLFTGMFQMEAAVRPLRELPAFAQLFQAMTNPILGVLVGAGVRRYPVLLRLGGYFAGPFLHRGHHLGGGGAHHPGPEHRHLRHPHAGQRGGLQKRQAGRLCPPYPEPFGHRGVPLRHLRGAAPDWAALLGGCD